MSLSLDSIKARIVTIETAIQNSLSNYKQMEADLAQSLANHNALLGALQEAKNFLMVADDISKVVAPESPVTELLNKVEEIVN